MVQCRGPEGERLPRAQWSQPVEGDLEIRLGRDNWVATLERPDVDRRHQVLYPLFDVRVQTFEAGLLVVGYQLNVDAKPIRECRQAWFCVPVTHPLT